jgi:hypothetical protein
MIRADEQRMRTLSGGAGSTVAARNRNYERRVAPVASSRWGGHTSNCTELLCDQADQRCCRGEDYPAPPVTPGCPDLVP